MNDQNLEILLSNYSIVIYDGICGFCDASIQFILNNKPSKKLKFVSFQSKIGQRLVEKHHIHSNLNTIILIENNNPYQKSKAIFKIMKYLNTNWRFTAYLQYIPSLLSNLCYDIISKNRYRLMGKVGHCKILTLEERLFFLGDTE